MRRPVRLRSAVPLTATLAAFALTIASLAVPALIGAAGPTPVMAEGTAVYDTAELFSPAAREQAERIIDAIDGQSDTEIVVLTESVPTEELTAERAEADADALASAWGIGLGHQGDGMVMLFAVDPSSTVRHVRLHAGPGFPMPPEARDEVFESAMRQSVDEGHYDAALLAGLAGIVQGTFAAPPTPGSSTAPGPPFPEPVPDKRVYDFAGIFSPATIAKTESTIDELEARTGAQVVVYTQPVDYGVTSEETEARAIALMDQWGIGRKGFDDGMVLFFDIDPSGEHGQVQLYAGPGFRTTFLTNEDRQRIYDNDMLPFLRNGDFDGALGVAMDRIDAAATPENAARLETGRQVNAVVGLGAPLVFMGLAGWALFSWRRYGKDPVYLDDPSILMPAPPPDLTAASGAFVVEGHATRRALTTAMLDLASRGLISFREEDRGLLGMTHKVGVEVGPPKGDDVEEAQRARNARRPIGPAEEYALSKLKAEAEPDADDAGTYGFIGADDLPAKFGPSVAAFDSHLEDHVVDKGWVVEAPSKVTTRWALKGGLAIAAGIAAIVLGANIPASGLLLIGGAAIAGGLVVMLFARWMPRVTMPGAMIRAMLAAYRRTLQKTMAQASSMQQVVDEAKPEMPWLETPDQAVVWGTALGLQGEIEAVLQRSLEAIRQAPDQASSVYFPAWYHTTSGSSFASSAATGSGGSIFSASAVPDIGGMMSALGTIGNSPSSSGGGGGFGGGGSGGGGGGAGGGF